MKYIHVIARIPEERGAYIRWVGYIPELPGCLSMQRSKKKCEEELVKMEEEALKVYKEKGYELPTITDASFIETIIKNWTPRKTDEDK
jgi:predicted RNase H-like HicB family nuclease